MVFLIRMAHRKQQRYELKGALPRCSSSPIADTRTESSIIGTGGFSTVYRALDRHTRRFVAIKVMGREHTVISEQEERVGYAILHPHLVRLLDSFRTRKHHYLVYELLEGRDLFDRIVRLTLPSQTELTWGRSITARFARRLPKEPLALSSALSTTSSASTLPA